MKHARSDYDRRIQDSEGLIPEDEPVLLIRGQDTFAVEMCKYYIELCRNVGRNEVADKVEKHLELMINWPKKKYPDVPIGV